MTGGGASLSQVPGWMDWTWTCMWDEALTWKSEAPSKKFPPQLEVHTLRVGLHLTCYLGSHFTYTSSRTPTSTLVTRGAAGRKFYTCRRFLFFSKLAPSFRVLRMLKSHVIYLFWDHFVEYQNFSKCSGYLDSEDLNVQQKNWKDAQYINKITLVWSLMHQQILELLCKQM